MKMLSIVYLVLSALPFALAQSSETVLGVYLFHRHGDRTPKALPPANLTNLGYSEVYTSGTYFRNRYVASNATSKVHGLNSDVVKLSQIAVSAPLDNVLQNSANGFVQALYPPVGTAQSTDKLRNGNTVSSPMDGYQLIPIELVTIGSGSEDSSWLQSASGCGAATVSSNNYFQSAEYSSLLNSTKDFYTSLNPVVNGTFNSSQVTFKNAYSIFDLINVAEIHNTTINGSDALTEANLLQIRTLADSHEWGLAYNASDNARAIAGQVLAAEILQFLNATITGKSAKGSFGIQFGAYASFASFFGLAELPSVNPDFYGVSDYASVMVFEMFTNASISSGYPAVDDIYVRFLFHNGTTNSSSEPVQYPLFGSGKDALSFNDFATGINKFAIGNNEKWCTACGNFTGSCAAYAPNSSASGSSSSSSSSSDGTSSSASNAGNGLSPAVNGVIGAMVTLAVILLLEGLILLVGGLRLVSKKTLANGAPAGNGAKA